MGHYLLGQLAGMGIGFVVGCFTPAIGRKLKALFVKDTQYVESQAKSAVGNITGNITKHL